MATISETETCSRCRVMRIRAPFEIMEWKDKDVPVRRKPRVWSVYVLKGNMPKAFCLEYVLQPLTGRGLYNRSTKTWAI